MGPDNAVHAGPWRLLNWPRQTPLSGWAQDIRVMLAALDTPAIELVDGPWSCAKHEFRENGLWLDLTLLHVESGRSTSGTFDMEDGVWAPSDGSGHMTVAEFHRAYASNATTIAIWPAEPFKDVHAPSELSVRSRDGQFLIDLTTNQWRMSDWICPPRIVHIPTGDCLLDLKTTSWDGRAEFRSDGMAELRLRQYPGVQFSLTLELDLLRERYRVTQGGLDRLESEGYIDELQLALGRSTQDLDELGVTIDVRTSRRDVAPMSQLDSLDFEDEPVLLAPLPVEEPAPARPSSITQRAPSPLTPPAAAPTLAPPKPAMQPTPTPAVSSPTMPAAPPRPVAPRPAPAMQPIDAPPPAPSSPLFTKPAPEPVSFAPLPPRLANAPSETVDRPAPERAFPATAYATPRGAEPVQRPAITPEPAPEPRALVQPVHQPVHRGPSDEPPPQADAARPVQPVTGPTPVTPMPAESTLSDAASSVLGLTGDDLPAPPPALSIRGAIEAIEAEVTRQRLNAALHYEMIVLGVIRAAASGITKPADAVSILQTLAARREDIGPKA